MFQWLGLRLAVEHAPGLAQKMGGVASRQEQESLETRYSAQLAQLQQQLGQTVARLQEMERSRQAFFARIGLGALAPSAGRVADTREGRGGPLKVLPLWPERHAPLTDQLAGAADMFSAVRLSVRPGQASKAGLKSCRWRCRSRMSSCSRVRSASVPTQ
ncbi:hypothetical protein [Limnohabitans sp.]|uniref:hypothetical protein n=1 Tax=Limnohabitans sp. TaxID=1907725 RepID=UPI0035AECC75